MAGAEGRAQLHIKEDCVITLITTKDAITDIIALLLLILFCALSKVEQRGKEELFFLSACEQLQYNILKCYSSSWC